MLLAPGYQPSAGLSVRTDSPGGRGEIPFGEFQLDGIQLRETQLGEIHLGDAKSREIDEARATRAVAAFAAGEQQSKKNDEA